MGEYPGRPSGSGLTRSNVCTLMVRSQDAVAILRGHPVVRDRSAEPELEARIGSCGLALPNARVLCRLDVASFLWLLNPFANWGRRRTPDFQGYRSCYGTLKLKILPISPVCLPTVARKGKRSCIATVSST